eukprot:6206451-Pleurochrysis_carterae.AAC.2
MQAGKSKTLTPLKMHADGCTLALARPCYAAEQLNLLGQASEPATQLAIRRCPKFCDESRESTWTLNEWSADAFHVPTLCKHCAVDALEMVRPVLGR